MYACEVPSHHLFCLCDDLQDPWSAPAAPLVYGLTEMSGSSQIFRLTSCTRCHSPRCWGTRSIPRKKRYDRSTFGHCIYNKNIYATPLFAHHSYLEPPH